MRRTITRVLGPLVWHGYGTARSFRREVWNGAPQRAIGWASDEPPRHDRHHTPYDPRLVVGCETARPGPIARFLMSRVRSAA